MLIDLLTSRCRSTQVKLYTGLIASIDLWPQEMFTFSEMLALVQSEKSSFGAFVCHRRPAGLQATSDLVRCHAGSCKGAEQISIDVGLWVAVCFLAKISFHRPTCKTTFARLTQSQAISQSFRVFITFSFFFRTSVVWNTLPSSIQTQTDARTFKSKIIEHFSSEKFNCYQNFHIDL